MGKVAYQLLKLVRCGQSNKWRFEVNSHFQPSACFTPASCCG